MRVYSYLSDIYGTGPCCVVLGTFDGLHLAHRRLLERCLEVSKEQGLTPLVFTFANNPANVISGEDRVRSVCTVEQKAELIEAMGFEHMACIPFSKSFMENDPEHFVAEVLLGSIDMKHAVCGYDYRFCYHAEGTPEKLAELGEKYGFGLSVIPKMEIDGRVVSSTLLRSMIAQGDLAGFERYAGRPYAIEGYVRHGRGEGGPHGFPTMNLDPGAELQLPPRGVYASLCHMDGKEYRAVSNLGVKPTAGLFPENLETYVFGFSGDAYGKKISVELIELIRPEMKFSGLEELGAQVEKDKAAALRALEAKKL